jgi:hypothetical protein
VGLASDPLLERHHGLAQGLVGAGGHPQLQGCGEDGRGEVVGQQLEHRTRATPAARQAPLRGSRELSPAHLGDVLNGRDDQVVLGREVVQLGAARHTGPLGHQRRRRTGEATFDEQLDGRLHQAGPHRTGPLLLRNASGDSRHASIVTAYLTNSQA